MQINERVMKVLTEYPATSQDQRELVRLQEFLQRMKDAGVARTPEYDLPLPDTLGRTLVARMRYASQGGLHADHP